jgi:PAS domain S-box-containing protein
VGREPGPDIVVRADARGVILAVADTCRVLGYEPGDLVGKVGVEFVHPDDRSRFIESTASLFRSDGPPQPVARVHRFLRSDGSWVWLRGSPRRLPTRDSRSGELINFLEPISAEAAASILMLDGARVAPP